MGSAAPSLTKYASGSAGASQAQGVDVAIITNPGKGRWRIWGTVRHTLADGCRLAIGPDTSPTVLFTICAGANLAQDFGPIIYDIRNNTDDIIVELATATGGSDSAFATIYAELTSEL